MNDTIIKTLLDEIVALRRMYAVGSTISAEIVQKIDTLVAYIKENY
jgi:hypothetical protein